MIGDGGSTAFMTRVSANTLARTGSVAGGGHGNP
jgi:hypothetical protein